MDMTVYRCACACHDADEIHGVPVTDVVEAAIACDLCKNDHVAVFKEPYSPPEHWKPENDATGDEGRET